MLATTPVSVDSALQRAHKTINERVPAHSQQATLRTLGDLGLRPLIPEKRFRLHPISANAQPAVAAYIWNEETGAFEAESIIVLTLRHDSIEEITAFRTPELFPLFGLPEEPPR
jgi:RNA polymerase sigma-70 factor, ECF subfamily